jgi:Methyltransferase domain
MHWFVDEFLFFRGTLWIAGWAFQPGSRLRFLEAEIPGRRGSLRLEGCGLSSPDIAAVYGTEAAHCRFASSLPIADSGTAMNVRLFAVLQDGSRNELADLRQRKLTVDPYHKLQAEFFSFLASLPAGAVLEVGSRNRSGVVRRGLIPEHLQYVGMDILRGDNVDVVGDAHELSDYFPESTFDAIFALSVFEHLLMPWKVALQMNRVLKPGGTVMITTHQAWPLHERPWDFWRFSDTCWSALFNESTGFEILQTALGEPASIVPHLLHPVTQGLCGQPACLASAVLCRKTGDSSLTWPVKLDRILTTMYPK